MVNVLLNISYIASVCTLFYSIAWLLIKGNKNKITYSFISCQVCIILWCTSQILMSFAKTTNQLFATYIVCYAGITFLGATWLLFSLFYCEINLSKKYWAFLYLVPIINFLVLITNNYNHLFYNKFGIEGIIYGPFFYVNVFYTYACVTIGAIFIYISFKKNVMSNTQVFSLLLAVLIPLTINVLYITGYINSSFDITPPAFSLSSILMLYATYRYNFLNVNAIAFEKAFMEISEGIIIYNKSKKITYSNKTVRSFIPCWDKVDKIYEYITQFDANFKNNNTDSFVETTIQVGVKNINIKQYNNFDKRDNLIATTLMFSDVSKYYELLRRTKELAISTNELAIEKERNTIAQTVHDTTGHTLTKIQSLTKLATIEYSNNQPDHIEEYLSEASKLARDGIKELRYSINNLKQQISYELISVAISQLADSIKGLTIDVCIQGEDSKKYSHLAMVIYESVREAITNCLKYADATKMDIIIKFRENELSVYVFDNGKGCNCIVDGNGITGIKKRIASVGGTVNVASSEENGFQITIKVPVE